jgi:hypothetical protein
LSWGKIKKKKKEFCVKKYINIEIRTMFSSTLNKYMDNFSITVSCASALNNNIIQTFYHYKCSAKYFKFLGGV